MNRVLPVIKWCVWGFLFFIAISLWVCLSLVPLNLAIGEKNLGHRYVEAISAEEIYRYIPESRDIIPPTAIHVKYQSHWHKGFNLEGTHLVQYELSDADFDDIVKSSTHLIEITEPMMFEEIDTIVSDGWYRRDQRKGYLELIVFDRNRKRVWRYLSQS